MVEGLIDRLKPDTAGGDQSRRAVSSARGRRTRMRSAGAMTSPLRLLTTG